jgi:hypothetical protein
MAAFTHLNPLGSRFSAGGYGVYYAARRVTAVREVSHHQGRFLAATREGPISIDLRCYRAAVREPLHDIRGARQRCRRVRPRRLRASQALGRRCASRQLGACTTACATPGGDAWASSGPARSAGLQGEHVALQWNGEAIDSWYVKSPLAQL